MLVDVDTRNLNAPNKRSFTPELQASEQNGFRKLFCTSIFDWWLTNLGMSIVPLQFFQGFPEANGTLPAALYRLTDPSAPVALPPPGSIKLSSSDNRELDKLVAALGRNKATWRRALTLHEWLQASGHRADDRLCTTLIRVCAQHGQAATALSLYDWMRAAPADGGGGLDCTVYTYTAAMRAALAGNMLDRALDVWSDAEADIKHEIDCRLCTTLIEVCTRRSDTDRALDMYRRMRAAPAESKLAPTVHAYTAAMRAAAEGGRWEAALAIWTDMQAAGCKPTGHAYSAVISACAAGGEWKRAVSLFDEMLSWGVKPDVVSCTALVTALGVDGQWERAEKVVEWMLRNDIRPNVRTYTALVGALANARQWDRAQDIMRRMKAHALGPGVDPNAYTYSALLKAMGDHGKWNMAEQLFSELEAEHLAAMEAADSALAASGEAGEVSVAEDGTESAEERTAADILVARTAELALAPMEDDSSTSAVIHGNVAAGETAAFSYFSTPGVGGETIKAGANCDAAVSPSSTVAAAAHSPDFSPTSPAAVTMAASAWTAENAAMRGLQLDFKSALHAAPAGRVNGAVSGADGTARPRPLPKGRGIVNEVVCGALMLAYERAGKWEEAVNVLERARKLGKYYC